MANAWVIPTDQSWGQVRVWIGRLADLGYAVEHHRTQRTEGMRSELKIR